MVGALDQPIDFFISRAGADAAFADQVGRIFEDAGYNVVLQQWDFANRQFMERMHAALISGARVIAHEPLNKSTRLIVMRVTECVPTGLLTALAHLSLIDFDTARRVCSVAPRRGRCGKCRVAK